MKELIKKLEKLEKEKSKKFEMTRYESKDFDYQEGYLTAVQNILGMIKRSGLND